MIAAVDRPRVLGITRRGIALGENRPRDVPFAVVDRIGRRAQVELLCQRRILGAAMCERGVDRLAVDGVVELCAAPRIVALVDVPRKIEFVTVMAPTYTERCAKFPAIVQFSNTIGERRLP